MVSGERAGLSYTSSHQNVLEAYSWIGHGSIKVPPEHDTAIPLVYFSNAGRTSSGSVTGEYGISAKEDVDIEPSSSVNTVYRDYSPDSRLIGMYYSDGSLYLSQRILQLQFDNQLVNDIVELSTTLVLSIERNFLDNSASTYIRVDGVEINPVLLAHGYSSSTEGATIVSKFRFVLGKTEPVIQYYCSQLKVLGVSYTSADIKLVVVASVPSLRVRYKPVFS